MIFVRIRGQHVANINRQHKLADGFDPARPWLLLRITGETERFPTHTAAREHATKLWAPCTFTRS